jgi:hypothetical protein
MQTHSAKTSHSVHWPAMLAIAACLIGAEPARAQVSASECGPLANGYGPYDYRTDKPLLPIVEGAHFTAQVESLIKGNAGYLGGDLDYTLRAFPNHHRALVSMMRYGERVKARRAPNAQYDVECYFVRAITFRPDDTTVRMLYATFLSKQRRRDEALQQLAVAEKQVGDNPFSNYNLGLVYFEVNEFPKALKQAHIAMTMGFPRPELKDKLVAAGHWSEPLPAAAAAPASAASQ